MGQAWPSDGGMTGGRARLNAGRESRGEVVGRQRRAKYKAAQLPAENMTYVPRHTS